MDSTRVRPRVRYGRSFLTSSTSSRLPDAMRNPPLRVVPLSDGWAKRDLQICIRSRDALPLFAKWLVDALLLDAKHALDESRGRPRRTRESGSTP